MTTLTISCPCCEQPVEVDFDPGHPGSRELDIPGEPPEANLIHPHPCFDYIAQFTRFVHFPDGRPSVSTPGEAWYMGDLAIRCEDTMEDL
jgi:hypothetical protein